VPRHAEALWNHALASALVGEEIARITRRVDPRGVFLPALFHDVGRIAFLIADAAAFETLHQRAASGGAAFAEVERTWFGFDHAEAGAILAEDWGLAPDQCEGVRWHHRPAQADVGQALAALLSAADTAAFAMGCESIGPQPEDVGSAVLGLDPESVAGCVDRTRESFAEQRALLD
jgi:HD-like signal output (HDOD) protein